MKHLGKTSSIFYFSRPTMAALLASLAIPAAGQASLLLGNLNISGAVNISAGRIDFNGPFTVSNTSTGDFIILGSPAQTTGTEKNIDNPPYAVDTVVTTPNFLNFLAAPNISVTLNVLLGGMQGAASCASPPAGGQNCTPNVPVLSPFNLSNTTSTTSTAAFTILGTEFDSQTGTSVPIIGVYSAQFTVPFQTILSTVTGGGTLSTSYSASFTAVATPELNSGLMLGCGTVPFALIVAFRRLRRRAF